MILATKNRTKYLEEMIFLFHETDGDIGQRENSYKQEHENDSQYLLSFSGNGCFFDRIIKNQYFYMFHVETIVGLRRIDT